MFCIKCGCELPDNARFCMSCGERVENYPNNNCNTNKLVSYAENSAEQEVRHEVKQEKSQAVRMTLGDFRKKAPSMTGFREKLVAFRKSLENSWDYNAFVGILLGVSGPKHGDPACQNFAIGQGDNGNNTKKTLESNGLMIVFDRYKGKGADLNVALDGVEDEILSIAPQYAEIRNKIDSVIFGNNIVKANNEMRNEPQKPQMVVDKVNVQPHMQSVGVTKPQQNNGALDDTYSSNSFTTFGCSPVSNQHVLGESVFNGNIVEYKDYIFAILKNPKDSNDLIVVRFAKNEKFVNSVKALYRFKRPFNLGFVGSSATGMNKVLSVVKDKVYFVDGERLYSMGLDGSNIKVIYESHNSNGINFCIAMNDIILFNGDGVSLSYYNILTGAVTKGWKRKKFDSIKGYSESGWINFNNELLICVASGEEINIKKAFKYKNLNAVHIDIHNKIAYFYDENKANYLDSNFVGVDIEGNIRDVWKMPKMNQDVYDRIFKNKHFPDSGYDALYFDGRRMVVKIGPKPNGIPRSIIEYSRSGDVIKNRNYEKYGNFGAVYYLGKQTDFFLIDISNKMNYAICRDEGKTESVDLFPIEKWI